MPFIEVRPVIDYSVRQLCVRPYPLHKKGCPNFRKKAGCPPECPKFGEVFDLSCKFFAIYNVFDFGRHVAVMKNKHPLWSERQLANCLYWQPKARKQLKQEIKIFLEDYPGYKVEMVPEAMGINVTATMKAVGIELEWPPRRTAHQVALAGMELGWERTVAEEAQERYRPFKQVTSENMEIRVGDACEHPGCRSHVTHPCEGCGRQWGVESDGEAKEKTEDNCDV